MELLRPLKRGPCDNLMLFKAEKASHIKIIWRYFENPVDYNQLINNNVRVFFDLVKIVFNKSSHNLSISISLNRMS